MARYTFTGLNKRSTPNTQAGLTTKFGSVVLDDIAGVTTLNVSGRGLIENEFTLEQKAGASGAWAYDDDRVPSREIEVEIQILSNDIRVVYDKLNNALHRGLQDLSFSDDVGKHYEAKYSHMSMPKEDSNNAIVTLFFVAPQPFRYGAWKTKEPGDVISTLGTAQAEIRRMEIEVLLGGTGTLRVINITTSRQITINKDAVPSDKFIISYVANEPILRVNGQPAPQELALTSEYEEMQYVSNGDKFGTSRNASVRVEYRDRWF